MSYEVGNLDLTIKAVSTDALASLDAVIKKLNEIDAALSAVTKKRTMRTTDKRESGSIKLTTEKIYSMDKLGKSYLQTLTEITKSKDGLDKITTVFGQQGEVLSKTALTIDKDGNKIKEKLIDVALVAKQQDKTWTESTYAVGRFGKQYLATSSQITKGAKGYQNITETFNEQGKVIKTVTKTIDEYGNKVTKISGKENKLAKKGAFGLSSLGAFFAKMGVVLHLSKRLGNALAKIVDYGNDFTETLNMWQVAFKGSLDTADKFVSKMHRAYGISTETLMRNQAIYKNMLAQMGYMTETTSTMLSESITQMVLDYSSLWNTTIESASEKFKAMLAGQIRPIRAISGISVEEKAIYDIYAGMGGTKTMRQLNQTEKRLLRIYATFSQMASSGAVGDFAKTIEQFANQSRLMTEYWKELVTWIGIGVKELLQASGIMQYINASLIFATELIKAIVMHYGYEDPNFLDGIFESAEEASDAVDDLKGKLLGFDKFRALEDTSAGVDVNIDEKVLALLSQYQSVLDNVTNKAQTLAESWLATFGFTRDENGELTIAGEKLDSLIAKVKVLGITIGSIFGAALAFKIVKFFINPLNVGLLIAIAGVGLLIAGIFKLIDGDVVNGLYLIAGAIGAIGIALAILTGSWIPLLVGVVVGALVALGSHIYKHWDKIKVGFMQLVNTIANAFVIFINIVIGSINKLINPISKISELFGGKSISIPFVPTVDWGGVGNFAQGGLPDKGSLFIAGEAGAEIVANTPSGQSAVMNMQQLQSAITRGMVTALSTLGSGSTSENITIKIGEDEVFTVLRKSAKRRGLDFARV